MLKNNTAVLVLEDGTVFKGRALGAIGITDGELVFNTSHSGYQEILTDPSYCRQIVCISFPMMGNYSFDTSRNESDKVQVAGFIVYEASQQTASGRSSTTLHEYLRTSNIVGIQGVDTRAIVRRVRGKGAMRAVISSEFAGEKDIESILKRARSIPLMAGLNLVDVIDSRAGGGMLTLNESGRIPISLIDFGVKQGIINALIERDCRVILHSSSFSAEELMRSKPAGVLLSNGPGDPSALPTIVAEIRKLIGRIPIFGICLGHQLLALAAGAKTYKLPFGHRGGNHPVLEIRTNSIVITSQNHGFAVDEKSLPENVEATERNLYDGTNEGICIRDAKAFSVQYHPEARPGPHESKTRFDSFIEMVKGNA